MSGCGTVRIRTYDPPEVDRKEILRYAGVRGELPELDGVLEECLREAEGRLTYRVCWTEFPLSCREGKLDLGFAVTDSASLGRTMERCDTVVLFAATVGVELDRLIARYGRVSPVKSLLFQAIGAERIEALCDAFNRDVDAEQAAAGRTTTRRFSPGYGDLPLALQKDIFRVLDCPKRIGLTLNESLLMSPSKSVTALIGVSGSGETLRRGPSGCGACGQKNCAFRRTV